MNSGTYNGHTLETHTRDAPVAYVFFPEIFSLRLLPSSPTRRGGSHLRCQKSHPRAPTTTRPWPVIAHWRARRSSGRRPGSASWLPREPHLYGKTLPRRALTALRSTSLKLKQDYEFVTRETQTRTHVHSHTGLSCRTQESKHTTQIAKQATPCPHHCTA